MSHNLLLCIRRSDERGTDFVEQKNFSPIFPYIWPNFIIAGTSTGKSWSAKNLCEGMRHQTGMLHFFISQSDLLTSTKTSKDVKFCNFSKILTQKFLDFVFLFKNAASRRKSKGGTYPSILTNCPNNIFKSFLDIAKIIFREQDF